MPKFDLFMAGIGGQGILTISDILCTAAAEKNLTVNYYPTKGMSQRGGFVKAQLRIAEKLQGPVIPPQCADLLLAMELSESLKGLPYLKKGGEALVYAHIWAPTAVQLGEAAYPAREQVAEEFSSAKAKLTLIEPWLNSARGENIFVLGAAVGNTALGDLFAPTQIEEIICRKFPKAAEINSKIFRDGLQARNVL